MLDHRIWSVLIFGLRQEIGDIYHLILSFTSHILFEKFTFLEYIQAMRIHISIMVEALGFYTHFPYQVFIFSPNSIS